jgi:hypothetical protein
MNTLRLAGIALAITAVVIIFYWKFLQSEPIDFNTQVKPILNKRCIACHGGVKREANFSLLFRQEALAKAESGKTVIVPGDPSCSEFIHRITSTDPEIRMPYKKNPLTPDEVETLTQWIKEGAPWGNHWAYLKVEKQNVSDNKSGKSNIDYFIDEKLEEVGLVRSRPASKEIVLRRTSLDITGLPPSPSIKSWFLNSQTATYEKLIDTLLASPHYGERWAAVWMDLARYADTKGYERDDSRNIWRYRDWLIQSFNNDMPYDSFLIQQLAGDLLSNPSDAQYIATAFHRNTMTNDEGGTDNEEFRTAAVLDRVNTTWEALMGTTFACVQCHTHPYDPFRHEEYYKFVAFFNNTRDEDTFADYPLLKHFEKEDEQKLEAIRTWIERNNSQEKAKEIYIFLKTGVPAINSLLTDRFTNSELSDTKWLIFRNNALCRLANIDLSNKNKLIYRYVNYKAGGTWTIHVDKPDGPILKKIKIKDTQGWQTAEEQLDIQLIGKHDLYFTYTNPNLKKPEDNGMMFDWFYFSDTFMEQANAESIKKDFWLLLNKNVPATPILMENPLSMKRMTQVFIRGNWHVKGDTVEPDVPAALPQMSATAPRNRLGLAMWMTNKTHPLTSRTIVNRIWEQVFGIGLAETLEDMGTQGIPPTHPELLNHLSWKLMNEYQWSLKKLIKEIVLSDTYRQDSKITPELLKKDPLNTYYARAPRVRLSAEQLRDQALAVSGLLNEKMFGPSVMPYQPDGIWLSPWNGQTWKKSEGDERYRRGLYTYWKRTAPYPSMMTFDGSAREVCTARRIKTNTPLQALVMLNDSVYVEAANHLAVRMLKESQELSKQIEKGYEWAIGQPISTGKRKVLENLYNEILNRSSIQPTKKGEEIKPYSSKEKAMTLVANAILNLDEFVTKN